MELKSVLNLIDSQEWLGPMAESLQGAIRSAYKSAGEPGQQIKNFLHGTWLGHPLHAVLTDIPVGAWSAALLLDLLEGSGRDELAEAADLAVTTGVLGAAGAALAGFTDWEHLRGGRAGKIGLVHAALNTTALLFYITSLNTRRMGARGTGRVLAYLGYSLAGASAYLGGELVYSQRIGVDHTAGEERPDNFIAVLDENDLAEGQMRRVDAEGAPVLLVRQGGHIYAMSDTCAHLGCSLAEGKLASQSVICACHGSRFALEDGHVLDGPSTYDQPYYDARIRKGQIEVRAARDNVS